MTLTLTVLTTVFAMGLARPWSNLRPKFNIDTPQIVGGHDSVRGKWPWQLSLEYHVTATDTWWHTCGASLIDSTHALTAAHCTHGRYPFFSFRVVLGAYDLSQADHEDIVNIVDVVEHEDYNAAGSGYPNDIAILTLEKAVEFNEFVQPVSLSRVGQDWVSDDCWASGWGYLDGVGQTSPNQLQEVELQTMTNAECVTAMPLGLKSGIRDTNICTGDVHGKKGTCQGDSGGPLGCKEDGVWYLAGVVSWGVGQEGVDSCITAYPSVYTRVSEYISWIEDKTRANKLAALPFGRWSRQFV